MQDDPQRVDSVTIVGGGDAGLLTALALEKGFDGMDIVVVDDFEAAVPEVGKSTLLYIVRFLHDTLDIDYNRMISNVKLSWKTSVYLKDWCGEEFHSPLGQPLPTVKQVDRDGRTESKVWWSDQPDPDHEAEFHEFYYRYEEREFSTMYGEIAESPGKTPLVIDDRDVFTANKGLPDVAYQFDSRSFNAFLRTICRERGVELVNDRITAVETSDGRIESIASEETTYSADLYVDASGFGRVLMDELDNPLIEFDLPVDSAVVTTVDIPFSEIVSATVVTTGDAGWFWQIDAYDVRDLGYVYSSEHLSDEAAEAEFVETREEEIDPDDIRRYRFDSGVLETPWRDNCVAIGNALGFVEPLQSTALTTTALLAERLATLLGKHGRINHEGLRRLFNTTTWTTWEEVYDFVSLYYKYSSGSTPFWEDARSVNPGTIQQYESYQESGLAAPEIRSNLTRTQADLNPYNLYYTILRGLGVDSEFYETLDFEADPGIVARAEEYTAELPERAEEYLSYDEFYTTFHSGFE